MLLQMSSLPCQVLTRSKQPSYSSHALRCAALHCTALPCTTLHHRESFYVSHDTAFLFLIPYLELPTTDLVTHLPTSRHIILQSRPYAGGALSCTRCPTWSHATRFADLHTAIWCSLHRERLWGNSSLLYVENERLDSVMLQAISTVWQRIITFKIPHTTPHPSHHTTPHHTKLHHLWIMILYDIRRVCSACTPHNLSHCDLKLLDLWLLSLSKWSYWLSRHLPYWHR